VDKEYLKEIKEILKKGKRELISKNRNKNLTDNPIFIKYFDLYSELSDLCLKKNAKINLNIWDDFIQALETAEQFNNIALTKINDKIINNLKERYKDFAENIFYTNVRKGKRKINYENTRGDY